MLNHICLKIDFTFTPFHARVLI